MLPIPYLEILKFIKDAIAAIFNKLGIVGVIAVALLLSALFEYHIITKRDDEIVILKNDIIEQNKSIDRAAKEHDALVVRVQDAETKNTMLNAKYNDLIDQWNRRPIPTNCADAIKEVQDAAAQNAKIWNSGGN